MQEDRVKMGDGGRLVIPSFYRKAMGFTAGDELVIRIQDGEIRLFQQMEAMKRMRSVVKQNKQKEAGADDFLEFRRMDSE